MLWWRCGLICLALAACGAKTSDVDACLSAAKSRAVDTQARCERAWQATKDVAVAVEAAQYALVAKDYVALKTWAERAPDTIEGARILHFWGSAQQDLEDLEGAETTLRRALALRVGRDPLRAANTAQQLLSLVQGYRPASESLLVARTAWEQAMLTQSARMRAMTASSLVILLIDLGELATAEAVWAQMPAEPAVLRDYCEGLIQSARGRTKTAISLFDRASKQTEKNAQWASLAKNALVDELVSDGRIGEARKELDAAIELYARDGRRTVETDSALAAARATVALAEDKPDEALSTIAMALATPSRDSTRVWLLAIQGDAFARRGEVTAAEHAWRAAADLLEDWRASIPSTQLRSGLVAHQRRALEAWLDSAGARGDVTVAIEVVQRILGRALLDRLRQREANTPARADASIRDVLQRLELRRELAATVGDRDLSSTKHDLVAFMLGARSVWAIRHAAGGWSISRVGDRKHVLDLADAYRRDPDDANAASELGAAMFPDAPARDVPLAVLLDHALSDLAIPGLRTNGRYLVEHAPTVEVLAPALLPEPVRPAAGHARAIGDPLGDLPAAVREVRALPAHVAVDEYIGARATSDALVGARDASLLHVAAHSTVADGRAALVLHDKPLSAAEIVNLRIAPRVAVIATCRSQVADDPATSLVAAFLAAGASGVIGVKRSLVDEDAVFLMQRFYAAGGASDPLTALAKAQRAAIREGRKPSTWAAVSFFGVGGWLPERESR